MLYTSPTALCDEQIDKAEDNIFLAGLKTLLDKQQIIFTPKGLLK